MHDDINSGIVLDGEKWLASKIPLGSSKGLHNIKAICKELDNPQKEFESIHIVGTNGKGSTSFYLANILQAHKIKVGLFTSPHLISVRERFRINNNIISEQELNSILLHIKKTAEAANIKLSYFEILTAAAFLWFKKNKVQIAVLEAGIGGRLDCTKIAKGNIVALTNVGLDHTDILGNTKEKILKEKLGIAKKNAIVITKRKHFSANLVSKNYGNVYKKNAELACSIAQKILAKSFNETLAANSIKKIIWHGRMQMLFKNKKLTFILDGAHNVDAAKTLAKCLKEKNIKPLPCIFASLTDKDTFNVLKELKKYISVCYAVQVQNPRARSIEEINSICKELKIPTAKFNSNTINNIKEPILITGSLYLVGMAVFKLCSEFEELSEFRGLKKFPNEAKLL